MAPRKNDGDKKPDEKITPLGFDKPKEDLKTPDAPIVPNKTKTILEINEMSVENYERSEQVINEIRIQKGCSREEAVRILTNPTK